MSLQPNILAPLADEAVSLLKALAHPARLLICCQLRNREMSVGEIEKTLDIRQPRLSRELAKLREDNLVTTRRQSQTIFYRLHNEQAHALIDALCTVMTGGDIASAAIGARRLAGSELSRPRKPGGCGVFARTSHD